MERLELFYPYPNLLMTPMKHTVHVVLAFLLCASPFSHAALEDWYKLLPADTLGIIEFKSASELVTNWEKSGLGRLMADEEFQRWTAPMRNDGDTPWDRFFKEHSGEGMREYLMRHPGANLAAFIAATPEELQSGLAYVSFTEVGDGRKAMEQMKTREKELALAADEGLKARVIQLAGEQVEVISKSEAPEVLWEMGHVFVGDVMIEANKQALMEQMIAALKTGAEVPSTAITGHLTRLNTLAGGTPDVRFYLNGEKLMEWVVKAAKDFGTQAAKSSPLPISPDQVIKALGLQEVQSVALMMNLENEQSVFDMALLHSADPEGLIHLMRGTPGQVEQPAFVPADVMAASAMRLSVVDLWDKLLVMVGKFGPAAALLTGQLGLYEQQLGVKLRDDLFASLDDQYHEITHGEAASPSQVIVFKIKDEKRLNAGIEGIKRLVGAGFGDLDESEYLGYNIQSIKTAQAQDGATAFAFCIAEGYLLMSTGPQTVLRDVLSRMKEPTDPGLWADAKVKDLVKRLPEGYLGLSVTDGSRAMKMLVDALSLAQASMAGQQKGGDAKAKRDGSETLENLFDSSAVPSAEMWSRYFGKMISGAYNSEDAIHMRMLSVPADQP